MENQKLWKDSREVLPQNSFGSLDMPHTHDPPVDKCLYEISILNPDIADKISVVNVQKVTFPNNTIGLGYGE